eukprot:4929158-Alexandrium_andersonii.AAC.1
MKPRGGRSAKADGASAGPALGAGGPKASRATEPPVSVVSPAIPAQKSSNPGGGVIGVPAGPAP